MKKTIKFSELSDEERKNIHKAVEQDLGEAMRAIEAKTGYYVHSLFSIYADELRKCIEIDVNIALIEKWHGYEENKIEWFTNINPDNCLDEPIKIYKHQKWYKIYDGHHRLEANRRMGKQKIKARIICPDDDK